MRIAHVLKRAVVGGASVSALCATLVLPSVLPASADTGVLARDSFNRADAGTLGTAEAGGAWARHNLTWGVTSGKAALRSGASEGVALLDARSANVRVSGTVTLSSGSASPGLSFRAADQNNQLMAGLTRKSGDNRISLHKIDGGTYTELAAVTNAGLAAGRAYRLEVVADKSSVKVLVDGTQRISHTLSSADQSKFGGRTRHGLRAWHSSSSEDGGSRWDDFEVRALGTAPAPTPTTPPTTVAPTPPTTAAPTPKPSKSAVDTAVYDMYGPSYRTDGTMKNGQKIGAAPWGRHEAFPKKLPKNFDFYHGARPGTWAGTPGSGRAVSGWGQLFEAEPGTGTYDARLQVRDHQLFFLRKDGRWTEVRPGHNGAMEGAWWDGSFRSQGTSPIRSEAGNGGGQSVALQPLTKANHATWHFWWKGFYPREVIPADAVGVFTVAQMRLIPDTNPNVDLSKAKFIASIGADNYTGATTNANGGVISAVMQPRMKYVTKQWNSFSGTTLTEKQLRDNPPPIG